MSIFASLVFASLLGQDTNACQPAGFRVGDGIPAHKDPGFVVASVQSVTVRDSSAGAIPPVGYVITARNGSAFLLPTSGSAVFDVPDGQLRLLSAAPAASESDLLRVLGRYVDRPSVSLALAECVESGT
jgi:hypothetical protein